MSEQGKTSFNYMSVFSLGNTIMFWCVRRRCAMGDAMYFKEFFECNEFSSIIGVKCDDCVCEILFNDGFKPDKCRFDI